VEQFGLARGIPVTRSRQLSSVIGVRHAACDVIVRGSGRLRGPARGSGVCSAAPVEVRLNDKKEKP
jgi:hypothetical protein